MLKLNQEFELKDGRKLKAVEEKEENSCEGCVGGRGWMYCKDLPQCDALNDAGEIVECILIEVKEIE